MAASPTALCTTSQCNRSTFASGLRCTPSSACDVLFTSSRRTRSSFEQTKKQKRRFKPFRTLTCTCAATHMSGERGALTRATAFQRGAARARYFAYKALLMPIF